MTELNTQDTGPLLAAHDVAAWLRKNPTFLQQFPDLALTMEVPKSERSASTLASYQVEVLRDRNRELNRRLQDLYVNAQTNEQLTTSMHQLTLGLMKQSDVAATWCALVAAVTEDFAADVVRVVTFEPVSELANEEWYQTIPRDDARLSSFRDCISDLVPICGRLNPDKQVVLYGARDAQIQSSALLPIRDTGLLAIGSYDPNRFYPGMGTLFLSLLGETIPVALRARR